MKCPECDDCLRVCEQYPARRTRLHLWLRRMPCPRCNAPAEGAAAAAAGRLQDEHNKEWLAQLKSGPGAPVRTPLQLPKDLNVLNGDFSYLSPNAQTLRVLPTDRISLQRPTLLARPSGRATRTRRTPQRRRRQRDDIGRRPGLRSAR